MDIFMIYMFLKRLVTPFDQTDAFRLGLIDADGKRLKKASTPEEKNATGYFDRLIFNLKRLLAKVPGGESQLASFAAALLLLREQDARLVNDPDFLEEQFLNSMSNLDMNLFAQIQDLEEDIANVSAGGHVAGMHEPSDVSPRKKYKDILRRTQERWNVRNK